jgi:hypothetical protein
VSVLPRQVRRLLSPRCLVWLTMPKYSAGVSSRTAWYKIISAQQFTIVKIVAKSYNCLTTERFLVRTEPNVAPAGTARQLPRSAGHTAGRALLAGTEEAVVLKKYGHFSAAPANVHELTVRPELTEGTTGTLIGDRNHWAHGMRNETQRKHAV